MTQGVDSQVLSPICENYSRDPTRLRVLLFCMKYPKLKFTTECLAVNQGVDRAMLEKEILALISQGILGKGTDAGITYYYLIKTKQELTELTEEFLRDWSLHGIANKS